MATAKASRANKTDNPPADTTRQLTSTQFLRTWRHYDTDRNGYIENDELDAFLKEMLSDHCGPEIDESLLAASKAKFLAKYDQNYDGRISLEELAVILPTEESFLLRFRGKINLSSVDFMQINLLYARYGVNMMKIGAVLLRQRN
ncbi:calbindin-32-like [Corticium candelabrum]|uniref:calbindin-32-like n=1 Tax=Corticium candelabrum TaxID=121492 RepID=UPI002E261D64|nr:calbindin-32-like [Corticium candelabrum]